MRKAISVIGLFFVLTASTMQAEQTGCNPHPQVKAIVPPTTLQVFAYTVFCCLPL